MKKSYIKLIIFDTILTIILLLNSFILNILSNYYYMILLLILSLIIFKFVFGFEKDRHRYTKDIIVNIIIILLSSFLIYYIFGIFVSFYRPHNYLNWYGIKTFIFPFIIMIILKEYLRSQMLNKTDKSKVLTVVTCILFIFLDISTKITNQSFNSNYNIFIFIALTTLPIISNNIACTYISKKVGYKPNILWLLVIGLYSNILPIVPNVGPYIQSIIEFLFPFVLINNVNSFLEKRAKDIPISYIKKKYFIGLPLITIFVITLIYFVSGYFRYYAITIATGSMYPNIKVGDVIIVDQKEKYQNLKIGDIIAYQYGKSVIVHRICDEAIIKNDYYFYTKGDNNENIDNLIVYPNMILGKVNVKIPYIGILTVWLNQLFK